VISYEFPTAQAAQRFAAALGAGTINHRVVDVADDWAHGADKLARFCGGTRYSYPQNENEYSYPPNT
jgi:hypothetical protein